KKTVRILTFFILKNHSYRGGGGNRIDNMKQEIEANYKQIKRDIVNIIESELERIKNDPDLQHLVLQQ
ncbi:hypothetical protein SAMN05421741_1201, partial [Paenimyroides ummariense]